MKRKGKSKSITKNKNKTYNYPKDDSLNDEKELDAESYDDCHGISKKTKKRNKKLKLDKTNIIKNTESMKSLIKNISKNSTEKEKDNIKEKKSKKTAKNNSLYDDDYLDIINKIIEEYSSDISNISWNDSDKELSTKEKNLKQIRKKDIKEDFTLLSIKDINNGKSNKKEDESIDKINHLLFYKELEDNITFDGKIFKRMKNKNNINDEIIYKCIYNRKDEQNRQKLHLGTFCNATLKAKLGVRLNTKGYIISITKNHSNECLSLMKSNIINNN